MLVSNFCRAAFFSLSLSLGFASLTLAENTQHELVKPALGTDTATATAGRSSETDDNQATAMDESKSGNDKLAKVPTAADDVRNARILNNLALQSGWFPSLKIAVSNGMVTLEGHAKDAEQLAWLAKTADRLPAVIAVINKAKVDTPAVTDLTPAWKEFMGLVNRAKRALPLVLLACLLLAIFSYIGSHMQRGVRSIWSRHISNPFLLSTISKVSMIPVWVLFFYLALQTAGLSALATTIIGGTGALGIVLGFAFKDIANNYLSGLLLAIRSPFTKGDDIEVAGYNGYVQSLNMRGTTILDYDGNLILIPNAMVIQSVIRNRTTNANTRLSFKIGIGRGDPFAQAQEIIMKSLKEIPAVLQDPSPVIAAGDLRASALSVEVYFWINGIKDSTIKVKSQALTRVKEDLLASGLTLPDESREVVFTDAIKVQMLQSPDEVLAAERERTRRLQQKAAANLSGDTCDRQETTATRESEIKHLGPEVDLLKRGAAAPVTFGTDAH